MMRAARMTGGVSAARAGGRFVPARAAAALSTVKRFDNTAEVDHDSTGLAAGTPETMLGMKVRIYQESKQATQQGNGPLAWRLVFEGDRTKWSSSLMGWTSTNDPTAQVKLSFSSMDEAVKYAQDQKLEYELELPAKRKKVAKQYAYNYNPKFYGLDVAKK